MRLLFQMITFVAASAASACIEIENDLDRLACYDREAGRKPASDDKSSRGSLATTGQWVVKSETSDFKDTTDVFVSLTSENALTCRGYGAPTPATLILRCLENTTAVFIATDCHLTSGHGGYGQVESRVDDKVARSQEFDESTNNRSLGLWSGRQAIPFIKSMIGSNQVLFRFTPFNQSPVTAKFNTSGLEESIKPLREECGW